MSLRAVRVQPPPPAVSRARLRTELTAAGVPLPPGTPEHPLECNTSGNTFFVVVVVDSHLDDQFDATVRQVVAAHVPDPQPTLAQVRKARVAAELGGREALQLIARGLVKMQHLAYQQQRIRDTQLLDRLAELGINHQMTPLPARGEAYFQQLLIDWIHQQIDQGG